MVDIKKLVGSARQAQDFGDIYEWAATDVQVGRINLGNVSVNGPQDSDDFIHTIRGIAGERPANPPRRLRSLAEILAAPE